MTLGEKLNNPLNIRNVDGQNWKGQIGKKAGFCEFQTVWWGVRAAMLILKKYRKRGLVTIEQIISTWAPSSENDTEAYIKFICSKMHCKRTDEMTPRFWSRLVFWMAKIETRMHLEYSLVCNVFKSLKL